MLDTQLNNFSETLPSTFLILLIIMFHQEQMFHANTVQIKISIVRPIGIN